MKLTYNREEILDFKQITTTISCPVVVSTRKKTKIEWGKLKLAGGEKVSEARTKAQRLLNRKERSISCGWNI